MNMKNLKIKTQLRIGFGILFFFVVVLGTFNYLQNNEIREQNEILYTHPLQVTSTLGSLNTDILNIRLGLKDLMLAESDQEKLTAVQLMRVSDAGVLEQFDALNELYLGPAEDIDEAFTAYLQWKTAWEENIQLSLSGENEKVKENLSSEGVVAQYRNQMLAGIQKIEEYAENKSDALFMTTIDLNNKLNRESTLLIAVILVLSLIISTVLLRNIQNPLKELTNVANKFHKGDMNARSGYLYENEFGLLSASFNTLADRVKMNMELNEKVGNLAEVMLSEEESRNFFRSTLTALATQTEAQMAAIYLLSSDQRTFKHLESMGLDENAKKSFDADTLEGQFGAVITSGIAQKIKNIPDDTRFVFYTTSGKFIPREIITIPILSGDTVIAIISLASISTFSDDAMKLIDRTSDTMSARIVGILAYQKIKEFSEKLEHQNRELDTQKKELEAQSSELSQQNTELEIQKNQLNEANRLKTSFLSNMSHELRTPLNSVIALSGVLNRRLVDKIPEEEYSYLEVIERNGKNLLSLINDILDISRIEAGREEIEITKFDVNRLIAEVVDMIQPQANEKSIKLIQTSEKQKRFITSDADKVRHILQNLIGNAVKFTESGTVEIKAKPNGRNIEIIVKDTGIGIAEKYSQTIFDEFRQADGSTSRKFGGTGLGLAIAKKYANLLGGRILLKSIVDEGSEFTLLLPEFYAGENIITELIPEFKHLNKPAAVKPVSGAAVKTILMVEDSEPAVIQIKDLLEESGNKILVARNAGEAFGIMERVIPDAIILDLMMPGVDGFEVLRTLREAESTAHVPVLILTAKHITKEELKSLKQNNIHQLIQKGDVNRIELESAVTAMLFPAREEVSKPRRKLQHIEGKPMVLVVEDNPDNMITVKALLKGEFRVIEAVDGKEGIAMAEKYVPDLILMDIALPGIDGIEAFKAIRKSSRLQKIPIVALTASAMIHDREKILVHGFDAFIAKPIIEMQFLNVISEVLYGK
ncbi:response regulator [Acetobacterium bakii]|uniref:Stage 0 sporulation protein A homolog n=1 Tax=Acetobacterium bakii TaxID=52689 RepID=A0A0L6TZV0_9FIRM|nr:response regulator [Acetobacterium bakii]KNZ41789.1 histidine kinase [Acetobacterium bakii]